MKSSGKEDRLSLRDVFDNVRSSKFVRTITLSHASDEEMNIWSGFIATSRQLKKLPEQERKQTVSRIMDNLNTKGWNLKDEGDDMPFRKKLAIITESHLTSAGEFNPHSENGYRKYLAHLHSESVNDVKSYDFLLDHIDEVKQAAQSVLKTSRPASPNP